jgi:hypothetical protein
MKARQESPGVGNSAQQPLPLKRSNLNAVETKTERRQKRAAGAALFRVKP